MERYKEERRAERMAKTGMMHGSRGPRSSNLKGFQKVSIVAIKRIDSMLREKVRETRDYHHSDVFFVDQSKRE